MCEGSETGRDVSGVAVRSEPGEGEELVGGEGDH